MNNTKSELINLFKSVYETDVTPEVFFAPGRVNLIGEHTDYNGGHVFPCAISLGTYCAISLREDKKVRMFSKNFERYGIKNLDLDNYEKCSYWTDYPMGVIWTLSQAGYKVDRGFDIVFYGNLPNSSGLSSSASIEVLTAFTMSEMFGFNIDFIEIAKLCQRSENEYNGVNCGIMDQFSIAMGQSEKAIFLDAATLEYEYVPVCLKDASIVIASSNKKRGLADSKYNERRSECEQALAEICQGKKYASLGAMSLEEFDEYKGLIKDDNRLKRARHAVSENIRTIEAVEALNKNDIERFGKLMIDSHVSLRDDYEVTGLELDTLFEEALKVEGVIGTRMTGAGFGGCTVSIVKNENIDEFIKTVGDKYRKKIGYSADFYIASPSSGPVRL